MYSKYNLPKYNTKYVETWYQISKKNHDWPGFTEIRETADWVPGGKNYHLIIDKPAPNPETIKSAEKIWQSYGNADRWEFVAQQVYTEFSWTSHYTGGFNAGVGEDQADLVGLNGLYCDCKAYFDYNSMLVNTIDLFINKDNLTINEWNKKIKKLFHKDNNRLLAYANTQHKGYFIFRPDKPLLIADAMNLIISSEAFFPNVIATKDGYALDWTKPFELNFIDSF